MYSAAASNPFLIVLWLRISSRLMGVVCVGHGGAHAAVGYERDGIEMMMSVAAVWITFSVD